jgi:hypothetical protein
MHTMTTESFVFSQLNFNGEENHRRKRKHSKPKKEQIPEETLENTDNVFNSLVPKNRPITMSLFADVMSRPAFDLSKYILTPKGYIHNTIFPKRVPANLTDVHYITSFPQMLINDAFVIFSESESVLNFVLDQIIQLPCNVPIRWGVLFNLKFRRVFQCLTLEKWDGLYQVLKKHGFAKTIGGSVHLLDPAFDAPETINLELNSSLFECLESTFNHNSELLKTPGRTDNDASFYNLMEESNFTAPLPLPPQLTPIQLPLDSPAIIPVQRAKNNSIYAIHLSHSISPALADRFDPSSFSPLLFKQISEIYNNCDSTFKAIINQLKQLPVGIPLRWGVIFNKHLRVRSKREEGTSLNQWKQLKSILAVEGYLCDKTVANCAILKNKYA